jgi:hypothetical protein
MNLKGESHMNKETLKMVITGVILLILLVAAIKFAVRGLFPIAVVIIAAYIVYILVKKLR